ncbi:hypothetical protein ACLOJK_039007 [Asimina triloba]
MACSIGKEMDGVEADVAAVSGYSAAMVHQWVTHLLLMGLTAGMLLANGDVACQQRCCPWPIAMVRTKLMAQLCFSKFSAMARFGWAIFDRMPARASDERVCWSLLCWP